MPVGTAYDFTVSAPSQADLVHVFHSGGHRSDYQSFLGALLGLDPVVGAVDWEIGMKLLRSRRLLFATIGPGTAFRAVLIAVLRAFLGKRTSAICMIQGWYLDPKSRLKSRVTFFCFRLLNRWNRFRVFSIIPYELMPEIESTTSDWILDLCLWDRCRTSDQSSKTRSALAQRAVALAKDRVIVVFLGKATVRKGFCEIASIANQVSDRALIVAAGRIAADCGECAKELLEAGMLVEDRLISEEEFLDLYAVADLVWCRYDESSSALSSGVYGRAVQFGKAVIVREGSYLDRLSDYIRYPVVYQLEQSLKDGGEVNRYQEDDIDQADAEGASILNAMAQESINKLQQSL